MDILSALNLKEKNYGCANADGWFTASVDKEIISYNPSNGRPIASVYNSGENDCHILIQAAEEAYKKWRSIPSPKRGEVIRAIGDAIRQHKVALANLVSLECGKSKEEGLGEVQEMIDMADFTLGQSRMLYGKTMHSERSYHRMYEQWHPLGVVGVITAFNFPVAVWAWNAFMAAICGNTVIWKPSPKTPLSAVAVQHICNQVMADFNLPSIFSLWVTDSDELSQQFIEDKRVALVSFTGSTKVGRIIQQKVANRLGKTLLELSGNNAVIIDETADLDLAVAATVFGAVGTAGQRCTTTRRLFLHESIYQPCLSALISDYQKINIGNPLVDKVHMGPLIDQAAVQHFLRAVKEAEDSGGKVLYGGKAILGPGSFVEPTLIAAENHWPIVQQETFAPILYVMKYNDLAQAIYMQNQVSQGLSSSLFTTSLAHAELFLSAQGSDCGIANINIGTSGAEIGGAFGGEKDTGGGREAGSDAWQAYMRRQTNTINWGCSLPLAQGIKFKL